MSKSTTFLHINRAFGTSLGHFAFNQLQNLHIWIFLLLNLFHNFPLIFILHQNRAINWRLGDRKFPSNKNPFRQKGIQLLRLQLHTAIWNWTIHIENISLNLTNNMLGYALTANRVVAITSPEHFRLHFHIKAYAANGFATDQPLLLLCSANLLVLVMITWIVRQSLNLWIQHVNNSVSFHVQVRDQGKEKVIVVGASFHGEVPMIFFYLRLK